MHDDQKILKSLETFWKRALSDRNTHLESCSSLSDDVVKETDERLTKFVLMRENVTKYFELYLKQSSRHSFVVDDCRLDYKEAREGQFEVHNHMVQSVDHRKLV